MRHASYFAIMRLLGVDRHSHSWGITDVAYATRACDWEKDRGKCFSYFVAEKLLTGAAVDMPTCPACAVLVDMALELRGSK